MRVCDIPRLSVRFYHCTPALEKLIAEERFDECEVLNTEITGVKYELNLARGKLAV